MCGISFIHSSNSLHSNDISAFKQSIRLIHHRGPDANGMIAIEAYEVDNRKVKSIANFPESPQLNINGLLGHVRLSIIDVSADGHQPFHYLHYYISFNGEIYNYLELKEELIKLGYTFYTKTDTEVLVAAYDAWQEKCLQRFNGMFAFIIWDTKKHQYFIAADRFGVKPLYYTQQNGNLYFVSELKQLRAFNLTLDINETAVNDFLSHQYLDHNEATFYKNVYRFPKAHFTLIAYKKSLDIKFESYYSLPNLTQSRVDFPEQFKTLFEDAVKLRQRSDVPIGFAASGGLDSSAILYTAYHHLKTSGLHTNCSTFSAIFPNQEGDESQFIKIIEKDLNIQSNYCYPMENFSIEAFEKHIYHQDMPVTSTSYFAEWCVSKLVNEKKVKVLLIGQGGDELLAGYHHHFYRYCRSLILKGKIRPYLQQLKTYCELKELDKKKIHTYVLNEVKLSIKFKTGLQKESNTLVAEWNKADKLIDLLNIDFTKTMLPTYLRSDDRDSMAFSFETRHPFLDYRLVDLCFSMPDELKIKNGWQKNILREVMPEMPDSIRYRKDKKGYTTPQEQWLKLYKNEFESYLNHLPEIYKNHASTDSFLKYTLGAWFKVNELN
jgi:asparagine synthase (glutamine-hydrolysing)